VAPVLEYPKGIPQEAQDFGKGEFSTTL